MTSANAPGENSGENGKPDQKIILPLPGNFPRLDPLPQTVSILINPVRQGVEDWKTGGAQREPLGWHGLARGAVASLCALAWRGIFTNFRTPHQRDLVRHRFAVGAGGGARAASHFSPDLCVIRHNRIFLSHPVKRLVGGGFPRPLSLVKSILRKAAGAGGEVWSSFALRADLFPRFSGHIFRRNECLRILPNPSIWNLWS